jgi:Holliday junction resolvase RusA-like endonuclease
MPAYRFKLDDLPPSVNNLYRRTRYGGLTRSDAVTSFEKTVFYTLRHPSKPFEVPCRVDLTFTFAKASTMAKRDLDNMMKVLFDVLQKRGVFDNDALVHEIVCRKVKGDKDAVAGTISALE